MDSNSNVSLELTSSQFEKCKFKIFHKNYKIFEDSELKDLLAKWDMYDGLKILTFSFYGEVEEMDTYSFIQCFFLSPVVRESLNCSSLPEDFSKDNSMKIDVKALPCTVLSMDFFDKIFKANIAISDGTIRKSYEEYVDGITIADELRSMLLLQESEHYCLYSEEERNEFIFRIFKHLCIGGNMNQYEDNLEQYIKTTKMLYKDLICVRKCGTQKKISIKSEVFEITCTKNGCPVFPNKKLHEQDFAYLVINNIEKCTVLLYHSW
ncbi:cilia- and flagella-associated protein 300 [Parasteatoda tepidariorum]|uniref:cilia- and flagella-associated protein 300 n=1 Tax=Parasteatoda tepidariorum TaxID=114398 RepID=UPI0039BCD379